MNTILSKISRALPISLIVIFTLVQVMPYHYTVIAQTNDQAASSSAIVVPEGNDYATRVLKSPWDMNEFSDISQGLNFEGRYNFIQNYQVSNGIFSATSYGAQSAQFYALWPGFSYEMQLGKVGSRYPINSSIYKCLYMRMKVTPVDDDYFVIFWQNLDNALPKGRMSNLVLKDSFSGNWRMYQANLSGFSDAGTPAWNSQQFWPGLYIQPTIRANTTFQIDWIRLTDCAPVNVNLTWSAVLSQKRIWASIAGQQKDILIKDGLTSSQQSYTWDVQGMAPGTYSIGIENTSGGMTWLPSTVQIVPAPMIDFNRPSASTGVDYASEGESPNPWNMDPSDIVKTNNCATISFSGGKMIVDTNPPSQQPARCKGGLLEADPQLDLNMPISPIDGSYYRYLSFSMYIAGAEAHVPDGMIGRWFWQTYDGRNRCVYTSAGIPYDVGWHTYNIDLEDPIQGMPVQVFTIAGSCSLIPWSSAKNIVELRFDPNENYTGYLIPAMAFHQEYAWFTLTRVDQIKRGTNFLIQFTPSKSLDLGSQISYYYTTNVSNPTQNNLEVAYTAPAQPTGPNRIFLPSIKTVPALGNNPGGNQVQWNTANVPPGQYFVCIVAKDGVNPPLNYCSEAPVDVIP
jgi:hypothetical protein